MLHHVTRALTKVTVKLFFKMLSGRIGEWNGFKTPTKFTALLRQCLCELSSSVSELDEVVLVNDRLELDVLSGVGLVVEDGLRGVGVDLGGALVLGASPDHA